jgi:hypothetical protein
VENGHAAATLHSAAWGNAWEDGRRSSTCRVTSLVSVELVNACVDCHTPEKIRQLGSGKVEFPLVFSSVHGIPFFQGWTIDVKRSWRRVTDGQLLQFPAPSTT